MKYFKIYLKNNLLSNIALIVLSILLGVVTFKLTEVIKAIYNIGILQNNKVVFSNNIFIFIFILVVIFLINFISWIIGYKVHWDGMKNIRITLIHKVLLNNYNFFIENKAPEIWNDINLTSFQVSKFCKSLVLFVSKLIECVLFTYLVFKINFVAGMVMLILVPLVCICNIWVNKMVAEVQKNLIQQSRIATTVGVEVINSVDNIKVKNKYDFFLKKINKSMKGIHDNLTKNSLLICYWDSITSLIMNISPLLVIYCMVFISKTIRIQMGEIISLYTVMPLMMLSYKTLFSLAIEYSSVKPSLRRIDYILNYDEDKLGSEEIVDFDSLEFKDVKFRYDNGKVVVIPDINIAKGDKVLITGESGIGKSTMFDIILGLKKNYEGFVKINGIDIKDINIDSLRKVFGISFQENQVFNMSLEDNITLGRVSDVDFNKVIQTAMLEEQLKDKEDSIINNRTISGGERSRISIAQNIFVKPNVILIDEALSSIDEDIERKIMNNLLENFRDKTLLCISHRKSSEQYCNKVVHFGI